MGKYVVLYNPFSGNGTGKEGAEKITKLLDGEWELCDITSVGTYADLFSKLGDDDKLVITGGDGTLNRFVNEAGELALSRDIYYAATGSGNDFLTDIGGKSGDKPILINKYLKDLPTVSINGKDSLFINGIGYGIDGYCCEVGDMQRAKGVKSINYAGIAIKGLLFHYKPTTATVTVDGEKHVFKKAWLAPVMNGRYYGGGMMPTPDQDRLCEDRSVSVMIMHGTGKLRTLIIFPSIFKGEHIKKKKTTAVFKGHEITVEFDRPTALQIDGETVLGVTKHTVRSAKLAKVK